MRRSCCQRRHVSTGFVKDASFEVRKGEILGFSGLIGSGRTELMEAIVGLASRASGRGRRPAAKRFAPAIVHAANRCAASPT